MIKRRLLYSLPIVFLLIAAVAGWFATDYLGNTARQEMVAENRADAIALSIYASSRFVYLERVVKAMSGSTFFAPALLSKRAQDIEHANGVLDRYNFALNASVAYLMDADGMTVASSNRNDRNSFVGKSYHFRPYFQGAANGQPVRYFALGITTGKRGFYASHPVQNSIGKVLGVVTIKKDLDKMEAFFSKYAFSFLVSPDGIIFLSSLPAMALKSLWPLDKAAQEKLIASRQFGNKPFGNGFFNKEIADGMEVTLEGKDYFISRRVIDNAGWSIMLLTPTDRVGAHKLIGILATILACLFILFLSGIILVTDRSKEIIRQSEEKHRLLFDSAGDAIFVFDKEGCILAVNPLACERLGYTHAELMSMTINQLYSPEEVLHVPDPLTRLTEQGHLTFETVRQRKDGSVFPTDLIVRRITWDGQPAFISTCRDITERKQAEEALRQNEERYRTILEDIDENYFETDLAGSFTFVNDAQCRYMSYSREELIGMNYRQYIDEAPAKELYELFQNIYNTGKPVKGFEGQFISRDGVRHFNEMSVSLIRDTEGKPIGFRGISKDVTERKLAEEKIQQMAYHDSLTGLPNRKLFSDRLDIALAHAQRNKKEVGIAIFDLDNFKDVNDTLGHAVGDLLLIATAERLSAVLRKGDTVARIGGDEFMLILPDLKGAEDAIQVAQKIVDSFRKPFLIDTHKLVVTTSIGIAVYPTNGTDEGILRKNADIAMYQAKEAGRDRYQLFKKA